MATSAQSRLRPASQITDRAKRYRANSDANRPANPRQCGYCGSRRNIGVDHIDGNESHGNPENLMWACKSCNGKKSHLMKKAGIGTLTRQYNPNGSRSQQMQAYGNAIKVMRGEFEGDISSALATIKGTPASVRSAYTSRTWSTRKAIYGPTGRSSNPTTVVRIKGRVNPIGAGSMVASALSHSAAGRKASAAISKLFTKKNPRSKNPLPAAEDMFEMFHGMPSEEIIEITERIHVHNKLWCAGYLISMQIETENGRRFYLNAPDPDHAPKADVVYMCLNESYSKGGVTIDAGTQAYFVGGDQNIPRAILEGKAGLKADDFKEHMRIGWVTEVTYRTKKSFEKDGTEQVDFYHALGKEHSRGVIPMLVYKPRNPSIEWFGGRYKIMPRRGDIDASPGIGG